MKLAELRWLPVLNTETTPVPPYAALEVFGVSLDGTAVRVRKPTTDSIPAARVVFAGKFGVPASAIGHATSTTPCLAWHDNSEGNLAINGVLGTASGSYQLTKDKLGFRALEATTTTQDTLLVAPDDATTLPSLTIREVDGSPSYAATTTIEVDQADGLTLSQPSPGVVRLDFAGALTVREVDGTPSYAATTTIEFDQADGFVVSQPGAGVVRVDIGAATASQAGIVSTAAQNFGGHKTFVSAEAIYDMYVGVDLTVGASVDVVGEVRCLQVMFPNGGFIGGYDTLAAQSRPVVMATAYPLEGQQSGSWYLSLDPVAGETFYRTWFTLTSTSAGDNRKGNTGYRVNRQTGVLDGADGLDVIGNDYHGGLIVGIQTSASAARAALGLGTIATASADDYVTVGSEGRFLTVSSAASTYLAIASNLSDLASVPTARTNLGLVIGTNVQAYDADLAAIAALTTASYGRSLLELANAAALRTAAALGTIATAAAGDYLAVANNLSDLASVPTARTNLGLVIGTNVQAYDATLAALAALTIAANTLTIGTGADAFSQTSFAVNTFPARSSTGSLVAKTITDFSLSLADDIDAPAARTTMGLGTAAIKNTGTSGNTIPLLDNNETTWSGDVYARSVAAYIGPGNGYIYALPGDATRTGTIQFFHPTGPTRLGYFGFDTVDVTLTLENGAKFRVSGNHTVLGAGAAPTGGGTPCLVLSQATGNPTGIGSNTAGLIVKDDGGTAKLYSFDEAGSISKLSGLGTAAYKDTGVSGNTIPLLDNNETTWSGDVYARSVAAYIGSGNGYIYALPGDATRTGTIQFFHPTGPTRLGYFGFDTVDVTLTLENAAKFRVSGNHTVLGTGATPTGGGTPCLVLSQATGNPTGIGSNTAGLVAKDSAGTCELYAWDEAGNVTLISPHAPDAPASLYDDDDPMPRVVKEENVYIGYRRWTNESRKARLLERQFAGENIALLPQSQRTFVHEEYYEPTEKWEANQAAQVARRKTEVAEQGARRRDRETEQDAHDRKPAEERRGKDRPKDFDEVLLVEMVAKPMPKMLRGRLAAADQKRAEKKA